MQILNGSGLLKEVVGELAELAELVEQEINGYSRECLVIEIIMVTLPSI